MPDIDLTIPAFLDRRTMRRYDYVVQLKTGVSCGTLWETDDASARAHAYRLARHMSGKLVSVDHVWKHLTKETRPA